MHFLFVNNASVLHLSSLSDKYGPLGSPADYAAAYPA